MRSPRGSITSVGRGRYRVQLTRGRDPVTGSRRRFDRTISGTKRDAERLLDMAMLELGAPAERTDLTVKSYLTGVWLPWAESHVRSSTLTGYRSKCELYVIPYIGSVGLADLDPYALERWQRKLSDDNISSHSRLHAFRVLRTALRRAVKWSMIAEDPLAKVDAPRASVPAPNVCSASEAVKYIERATGTPLAPVVALALGGGLRRSEICALSWSDIDTKAGTVRVKRGLHQHGKRVWSEPTKSRTSDRTVVLPAWALDLMGRGVGKVTADPEKMSREYRKLFQEVDGLAYIPLRNLRHSSATLALQGGADIALVSKRLGHSQIGVTVRHYVASGLVGDAVVAGALDSVVAGHLGTSRGNVAAQEQVKRDDTERAPHTPDERTAGQPA